MHRHTLLAFAALAPLCLAAGPAFAQTTISGTSSTPVATSTAGDVTVAAGATLTVGATTPAITIDSNNNVVNSGAVVVSNNVIGGTGVLINGGNTGSYSGAGAITLSEDYNATDTANSDGVVEAPFAQGTGRYGLRLVGPAPFTGDISAAGSITVKGNDSYGVSLESLLNGSLTTGAVSIIGDRSVAIRETAGVAGNVLINNTVSATGTGAQAVSLTGDIGGQLRVYTSVTSTGFSSPTRPTDPTKIQATPADLQLSGPTFTIGADVAGGVYFGAPPAGTVTGATDDFNGDGVADGSEGTSALSSFSNAPALLVGSATRNVTLGRFGSADFSNNYGLIIRGTVTASGVYDGFSATAIQIGGLGGAVNIAGGLRLAGSASAIAYQADATAIHIGAGATVPELRSETSIASTVTSALASNSNAILIDAGASVSTLTNSGLIAASAAGTKNSATAIYDRSGTLSTLLNSGNIAAGVTPTNAGEAVTGAVNAIDLRANTTGVTLTQFTNTSGLAPSITGSILLGSGPNIVNLLGGSMTGALVMGSAAGSSITIDNGAIYRGALSYGGTGLAINVANGTLQNDTAATIRATSLNVGANSTLVIAADPANNRATQYAVSGAANIASGAKIGVSVKSLLTSPQSYVIITSPNLTMGATDTSLLSQTPYLFAATLGTNAAAGEVTLTLRQRTAAELGLNRAQTQAYDAVYKSLPNDAGIQAALLNQTTQTGLTAAYNQLLPQHSGGQFRAGQVASESIARTTAEADHFHDAQGGGGPWLQEIAFGLKKSTGDAGPYRGYGFGLAGGWEADTGGFGAVGLSAAFVTSTIDDNTRPGENSLSQTQLEGGIYWRGEIGGLRFDARAAGGGVQFSSTREALISMTSDGIASVLNRKNKANWSGYTLSGRVGVGYEAQLGWLFLRPQAHADYYRLKENSYAEKFGGDGFDLTYAARNSSAVTGTASLVVGASLGAKSGLTWRPQLEVGYRKAMSGGPDDTTAHFANGADFTLSPEDARKGGPVARLGLKADSDYFELMFEGGGEVQGKTKTADIRFAARLLF